MKRLSVVFFLMVMTSLSVFSQVTGPEIKFDAIEHNYGDIKESGGRANHTFSFVNTGTDTLILTKVQPGCGCTASDYTKGGIAPGAKGFVSAGYDPLGRPGPFKKSISVTSNAKTTPHVTLFISGNVIPKPKDFTDTFRVHLGDLLVDRNNPVFHNLKFNEVKTDTLKLFNNSQQDMELSLKEVPAHIQAVLTHSKLKPAGRGFLIITYDAAKAGTSGNRNDRIYLRSNDTKQPDKMIFVTANIQEAPPKPTIEQLYPYQMGNLRMTKNSVVFPQILNTETKSDTLVIYNAGNYPIQIDFQKFTPQLKATTLQNVVLPGGTSTIKISYDASKAGGFGFISDGRINLQTTDSIQPLKVIYVSANVKEDFSKLTQKQRDNAPKIEFENKIFDFGKAKTGNDVNHSFVFTNTGKSELVIRKVTASCGCTATNPEKTNLKPGETSKIDIKFNTSGRVGEQHKSITVITNDPANSEVILLVKGTLEKAE